MESARETIKGLAEPAARLRKNIPEVYDGYVAMTKAVIADGALPAKVKELMALAIGATRECDGCISSHARGALRRDERWSRDRLGAACAGRLPRVCGTRRRVAAECPLPTSPRGSQVVAIRLPRGDRCTP